MLSEVQSGATLITAWSRKNLLSSALLSALHFDSDYFGIAMGRISHFLLSDSVPPDDRIDICREVLSLIAAVASSCGMKQITLRVNPRDHDIVQQAAEVGFKFIDVLVTYAVDMDSVEDSQIPPPDDFVIRLKQPNDVDALKEIARISFTKDRFHTDVLFDRKRADSFHATWIENSLAGSAADEVIVAEVDGTPVGFTTLKINQSLSSAVGVRSCSMILSAVNPSVRGRGVYRHMIAGGLRWFRGRADVVDLGTQVDNLPVQRAWWGRGFKPVD